MQVDTLRYAGEDLKPELVQLAAKMIRNYLECSNEIQGSVRDMLEILKSPEADDDERAMALHTLDEALFPIYHDGHLGVALEDVDDLATENQPNGQAALDQLDREERTFAERLGRLMEAKGVSQSELAKRAGVGQPAISMMLTRRCRPQRRTIRKLADALAVEPDALWPTKD